jgi:hypothetical protein
MAYLTPGFPSQKFSIRGFSAMAKSLQELNIYSCLDWISIRVEGRLAFLWRSPASFILN